MGQNGKGKSTMFGLITKAMKPESGDVFISQGQTIAIARQVIPRDELTLTVRDFFIKAFDDSVKAGLRKDQGTIHDIDPRIDDVLEVVNLKGHAKMHDRIMNRFLRGSASTSFCSHQRLSRSRPPSPRRADQQLWTRLVSNILTEFLHENYAKTVIVISHDADFLNAFTDGVLYLDVYTKKIEQYVGNYFDVVEQIRVKLEKG